VTSDIYGLAAFADNYIWCLRQADAVAVVDPGDAAPVLAHLATTGRHLAAILITHHHHDHTDGIAALCQRYRVPVIAPAAERIPGTTTAVAGGDRIVVPELDIELEVIGVAGHTRGHVAYYHRGALFCGDTLFGCGCGRLFEGSAADMHAALNRLASLPTDTNIYCAHEYTASGLRFAHAVEPGNAALPERSERVHRLIAAGMPTVPFSLSEDLATNPFLRCQVATVAAAAATRVGRPLAGPGEVFAALRSWRDEF
jgi:hydroxyacylglutathione hydrolase